VVVLAALALVAAIAAAVVRDRRAPEAAVALVQRGAALARDRSISCELALLYGELLRDSGR